MINYDKILQEHFTFIKELDGIEIYAKFLNNQTVQIVKYLRPADYVISWNDTISIEKLELHSSILSILKKLSR